MHVAPRYGGNGQSPTLPDVQTLLTLPHERTSCGLARAAVRVFCDEHDMADLAEDAELLASELVGNAVEHTSGAIVLAAEARAGFLTVTVTDDDASLPVARTADPQLLDERGRGLLALDAIASDWGATRQGTGKCVWFRLP